MQFEEIEKIYWEITTRDLTENENGVFTTYYIRLQQTFLYGIKEARRRKDYKVPVFLPDFISFFTERMQRISIRTLIFEMKLCEECGELRGTTSKQRYHSFVNDYLENTDFLREIYKEYPFMYKGILQAITNEINSIDELLDRFAIDRNEINQRFYPDQPCMEVQNIGGGNSDSHNHGRKVYILELDNGEKLVYKPRNLAIEETYLVFLQWVFRNVGMECWWNKIWNRQEYGWCQWVSARPCISFEELQRYYQRNGILLCISYLLGTADIHYENLIAHGEYPVIVDLEMAIGSLNIKKARKHTKTEMLYQESVLHTGILPLYAWNDAGEGVNVGAINGEGGQLIPFEVPTIVESGTVNMHIEYRQPKMEEGKNLATLNGKFIEPYKFLKNIQEGFEKAYIYIMGKRNQVLKMLIQFYDVPVRFLIRNSQQYFMLLSYGTSGFFGPRSRFEYYT